MAPALAVLPVLSGVGLLLGGGAAMYADRLQLLQQEQRRAQQLGRPPDLVLVRYLSAVIGDPNGLPNKIFFFGVTMYMIGLAVTSCLQAHILANMVSNSTLQQVLLICYALISGVSGIVMTVGAHYFVPNSVKALVFHAAFACGFMVGGFLYGGAAIQLAKEVLGSGSTVRSVRIACAIAGGVACFFNFVLAGAAGYSSIRIGKHYKEEDAAVERVSGSVARTTFGHSTEDSVAPDSVRSSQGGGGGGADGARLTSAQIRMLRCLEFVFAIGQMVIGISLTVFAASGAAEIAIFPGAHNPSA